MKKALYVLLFSTFLTSNLQAQEDFKFGVTGGLINSNVSINLSALGFNLLSLNAINKVGFYVGAVGDIGISDKLHVQPELTYGSAGDLAFVYLPVMVKYYIIPKLNVQLGPQLSLSTNAGEIKGTIRDIEGVVGSNENLDKVIRKTGVDLGFGAGYEFMDNLSVQARYAFELTNRYKGPLNNALKVKSSTFNIGVVYFF
ncbi:hypothetical protein MNBD_BACTEROID03-1246 [hydrothermal vent metagenome]|uniref:Outer membrane protein beta-barrel domain-containing protein n=1 Tax=hydrothermal vent metagenome TaxID=652676 RepID=A0A3B0SYV6_9ZZZZ